jgi:hypothetical protein
VQLIAQVPGVVVITMGLEPAATPLDLRGKDTELGLAVTCKESTAICGVTSCLPMRTACEAADLGSVKPGKQQKGSANRIDIRIQGSPGRDGTTRWTTTRVSGSSCRALLLVVVGAEMTR